MDSKFEEFKISKIRTIRPNQFNVPNPWLERTGWLKLFSGMDRPSLLGLIDDPDTLLLRILWATFSILVQLSQQLIGTIGTFGRFEIVRTLPNQDRARPFRVYQDPKRIPEYSLPWKRILAFFVRTQTTPGSRILYEFTEAQTIAY